jgi:hypothetical protein
MGADHADAGQPMPADLVARPCVGYHRFATATRQISLRNTGVNTLWVSFDKKKWHDVACGTSWDDRVSAKGFWYCTQVGVTSFVVMGIALNLVRMDAPKPDPEELA